MKRGLRFEVVETPDGELEVMVAGAHGRAGVGFAVETWLQSETARPYRPWRPEPEEGPYSAQMAEIRRRV